MKKLLTVCAAFSLLALASANASEVRTMTMGDAHIIVKDNGNIWSFPSTINHYPDLAEAVFTNSYNYEDGPTSGGNYYNEDFARFGVHYQFCDENPFVLGIYVESRDSWYPGNGWPYWGLDNSPNFPYTPGKDDGLSTNRTMNLFYGRNLGGRPFGAHFRLDHSSSNYGYEYTSVPADPSDTLNSDKQSLTNFQADFGLTTGGGSTDLRLSLGYLTWTDEDGNVKQSEPDGNMSFGLGFRRFHPSGAKSTWVSHGSFDYAKNGIIEDDEFEEIKTMIVDLGIGLNYAPSSKVLAIADFGLAYRSAKYNWLDTTGTDEAYEEKITKWDMPYWRIGIDAEVLSWLDFRAGAMSQRQRNKYSYDEPDWSGPGTNYTESWTQNYSNNQTWLGLGFHFGNLELDTWVDPEFALHGPYFISGEATDNNYNGNMFFNTTATYWFGK